MEGKEEMSLRVWLPFTDGTLKQQGLNNASATVGGTVNLTNAGKLGKCATIGTAAGGITLPASTMISFTECSVAFWIKIISWNTSYATFFQAGLSSTPWNNYIFGILRNNLNSNLCFTLTNSSGSSSQASYITSNLNTGQWYHLVFTYKASTICTYIDGVLDKTYSTSYVPNFAGITNISIGRSTNNSNYQTNCNLNDFRIYDHCLSPMEVKELSKGLVLHYPLNRQGFGQENLFKNSSLTDLTSANLSTKIYYQGSYIPEITQDGLKFTWTDSSAREIDLWLDKALKADTYYTLSFIYRNNMEIGSSFYLRKDGHLVGYWSQSTIPYSEDWSTYRCTFKIANYQSNDATTGTLLTLFYSGYTANKWIELKQNSIKLEEGSIETPWSPAPSDTLADTIGLNGTTEYDCSGYCNNGTRTGTFNWTSDTSKYSVSTKFNGTEKISANSLPSEVQTVSFWVKVSTIPSGYAICYVDSNTQTSIGFYNGNSFITSCTVNANMVLLGTTFKTNEWNHIVLIKTGANTRNVYCNGVLLTNSSTNSWVHNGSNLSLGWRDYASGNAGWFNGQLCDFRAYATALSADDVKSLYQNSAYIDSSGNVYGAVHSEV